MRMLYVAIFIHNKGNQMRFHGLTIKLAFEFWKTLKMFRFPSMTQRSLLGDICAERPRVHVCKTRSVHTKGNVLSPDALICALVWK